MTRAVPHAVFPWSAVPRISSSYALSRVPFFCRRSVSTLGYTGWSYGAIPLIWVFMMMIRGGCLTVFNLLFRLLGEREGPCCCARWAELLCTLGCKPGHIYT